MVADSIDDLMMLDREKIEEKSIGLFMKYVLSQEFHDGLFSDYSSETEIFNPEFREGYVESSDSNIDFSKPFICNEVFQVKEHEYISEEDSFDEGIYLVDQNKKPRYLSNHELSATQNSFREGIYLVDQNENIYYLNDLIAMSQFRRHLEGKDIESECELEEVIDVRNQDMARVLKGKVRNPMLEEYELLMTAGNDNCSTAIVILEGEEGNVSPAFDISFYVPNE